MKQKKKTILLIRKIMIDCFAVQPPISINKKWHIGLDNVICIDYDYLCFSGANWKDC